MKKYKIGYTQGTFDTLHHGHINLLKKAKEMSEYLIVGVNSDELVEEYKNAKTIISTDNRIKIVESIKYVDRVVVCDTLDKIDKHEKYNFDVIFIGNDWEDHPRWIETKKELNRINVAVEFLPYTKGISTTIVKKHKE